MWLHCHSPHECPQDLNALGTEGLLGGEGQYLLQQRKELLQRGRGSVQGHTHWLTVAVNTIHT